MGGERCMTHESHLTARGKEAQPQVVVVCVRPQHKRRIAIVQLACQRLHVVGGQRVGVEYHPGRIAAEAPCRERIDLVNA